MKWVEMTSPAIAAVLRDVPLVMNISAVAQHGQHLPVGKDAMLVHYFLDEIEARMLDRALFLPQPQVCCSAHHMNLGAPLPILPHTLHAPISEDDPIGQE